MMAQEKSQNLGKNLILIGLFLQIIFFGLFLICGGLFHFRLAKSPTPTSAQSNWKKHMYVLYATGILILIRSLFRVAEFAGGHNGKLQTTEVYLYIFDAILMLGVMVIFNVVHPGEMIGRVAQGEGIALDGRDSSTTGLRYESK